MLLSGTRGSLFVPAAGILVYLILIRNFWLATVVGAIGGMCYYVLKYTFFLQSVYEINRIRTALDPNNPSLLIRIEHQKMLIKYLQTHILGGGVGSAGSWGLRFSPNTFLAQLPLDSWYVKIVAEYGYIGLAYYLFMLIVIMVIMFRKIVKTNDPEKRTLFIALYCGLSGVLVGSYGNQIIGQLPIGICVYLSIFFMSVPPDIKPIQNLNA
jgi:O-antigen ligase